MVRRFTFALAIVVVGAMALPANAAYVAAGNTRAKNGGVDGSVSVAVFDKTGGSAGDTYGTGIAGFDALFAAGIGSGGLATGQAYLYLYQISNDGTGTVIIGANTVQLNNSANAAGSWGYFATAGFIDSSGAVGAGNPLGADGAFTSSPPAIAAPLDTSGALPAGIVTTGIVGTAPAFVGGVPLITVTGGSSGVFGITFTKFLGGTSLASGATSFLYGYTSNIIPDSLHFTGIIDGVTTNGTVFGPATGVLVPVPTTAVLLLSLCPFLGIVALRRRRAATV